MGLSLLMVTLRTIQQRDALVKWLARLDGPTGLLTRCLGVAGKPCGKRIPAGARKGKCAACLRELDRRRNNITPSVRRLVFQHADGRCELRRPGCTGRATTVDHIVPVSQGGTDALDNYQAACGECNAGKRDRG